MTRFPRLEPRLAWRWAPFAAAAVVLADQLLKAVVVHSSAHLPLTVVGAVKVEIVHNTGISFSRFTGAGGALVLAVALVTIVVATLLLILPRRYSLALALVLGGERRQPRRPNQARLCHRLPRHLSVADLQPRRRRDRRWGSPSRRAPAHGREEVDGDAVVRRRRGRVRAAAGRRRRPPRGGSPATLRNGSPKPAPSLSTELQRARST